MNNHAKISSVKINLKSVVTVFLILMSLSLRAQEKNLVVVDPQFSEKTALFDQLPEDVVMLELDTTSNPWKRMREVLVSDTSITAIHLFSEASYNAIQLGDHMYDMDKVKSEFELSMLEGIYAGTNYQLLVYNCNLGSNTEGLALLKQIGSMAYFNVAVPTNCQSIFDPNLTFDHTTLNQSAPKSIFK